MRLTYPQCAAAQLSADVESFVTENKVPVSFRQVNSGKWFHAILLGVHFFENKDELGKRDYFVCQDSPVLAPLSEIGFILTPGVNGTAPLYDHPKSNFTVRAVPDLQEITIVAAYIRRRLLQGDPPARTLDESLEGLAECYRRAECPEHKASIWKEAALEYRNECRLEILNEYIDGEKPKLGLNAASLKLDRTLNELNNAADALQFQLPLSTLSRKLRNNTLKF